MARKPAFKFTSTKRGWKVEIPSQFSSSGKRERAYFSTRDKAKEFATKLKESAAKHGTNTLNIRPSLAEEALKVEAMLQPYGISLTEAARRIVEAEKAKAASKNVTVALAEFLLTKDGKSDAQSQTYTQMQTPFAAEFGNRQLSSITPAELLAHVEKNTGTDSSFNRRVEAIKTFWRWCSKLPRNWCDPKMIEVLEKRQIRRGHIEVLTAEQCATLMQVAEKHYPECVPAFAISLFTGIRNAELERLTPEDITSEGITVSAESAKTNRRRFIETSPVLAAWLKAYPVADTVLPSNWIRKEKAVRRLAGWKVWCNLVTPADPPDNLPEWPSNALRHTHASVVVALGKPLDNLTFEFGHSGGAAILKSHYVGVMSKAEAIKIWSTGPNGTEIPVIAEVPSPFSKQAPVPTAKKSTKKRKKRNS
jgi:integrase